MGLSVPHIVQSVGTPCSPSVRVNQRVGTTQALELDKEMGSKVLKLMQRLVYKTGHTSYIRDKWWSTAERGLSEGAGLCPTAQPRCRKHPDTDSPVGRTPMKT